MPIDLALGSNSVDFPVCSHTESRPDLETKCSVADILLEVSHLSDQLKCLHCLLLDIYSSSSLSKLVSMRWELARQRLLLRSLISTDASMGEFADSKGPGGLLHALSSQYLNHDRCCEQLDQDVKTPIFPWIDPPDSYYGVIFLPHWLNLRTGSKTSTLRANLGLHQPLKNLWDVTGKDIDRFLKPMLDSWLEVKKLFLRNYDLRFYSCYTV